MKNKLFLTEDEKNRILALHKQRIAEEQNIDVTGGELEEDDPTHTGGWSALAAGAGAGGGALIGLEYGSMGGPIGAVIGTIAGAALGYLLTSGGKSYEKVKRTLSFCQTHKKNFTKPTKDENRQRELARDIRDALSVFGWTNLNDLRRALQSCETVVDLCAVSEKYDRMFGETLFDAIDGDIDNESEWLNYVWLPIEKLVKNTPKKPDPVPTPKNPEQLKRNAIKCGWITDQGDADIEGYKNSGWKCPKKSSSNQDIIPNPPYPDPNKRRRGPRYTFDYDTIINKLNEKCKGKESTTDKESDNNLNWRGDQQNQSNQNTGGDPNLGKSTYDSMTAD